MNDGGPAHPTEEVRAPNGELIQYTQPGMSLRDYFAGQALVGLFAEPHSSGQLTWGEVSEDNEFSGWRLAAEAAYEIADAMLKARQ